MIPYSFSQLSNLVAALRYAESRRMFWWQATGSHEYFMISLASTLSFGKTSARQRALNQITSSDANFDSLIQDLNSF